MSDAAHSLVTPAAASRKQVVDDDAVRSSSGVMMGSGLSATASEAALHTTVGCTRRTLLKRTGAALALASVSSVLPLRTQTASASNGAPPPVRGLSADFAAAARSRTPAAFAAFEAVEATAATHLRFPMSWDEIEPRPGTVVWKDYSAVQQRLAFNGWKGIPVISGCPEWLSSATAVSGRSAPYPTGADALAALERFVLQVIGHYSMIGTPIEAVELWPAEEQGLGPPPNEWLSMTRSAIGAVESANDLSFFNGPFSAVSGSIEIDGQEHWKAYAEQHQKNAAGAGFGVRLRLSHPPEVTSAAEYAAAVADAIAGQLDSVRAIVGSDIWVMELAMDGHPVWGEQAYAEALTAIAAAVRERPWCRAMIVAADVAVNGSSPPSVPTGYLLRDDLTMRPTVEALQLGWGPRR